MELPFRFPRVVYGYGNRNRETRIQGAAQCRARRTLRVSTTRLNQQVRRNLERFPEDLMLQLGTTEYAALMLQNATSKPDRSGRRRSAGRLRPLYDWVGSIRTTER
jgi:hypothetical protein